MQMARGNPAGHLVGGLSSAAENPEQVGVVIRAEYLQGTGAFGPHRHRRAGVLL